MCDWLGKQWGRTEFWKPLRWSVLSFIPQHTWFTDVNVCIPWTNQLCCCYQSTFNSFNALISRVCYFLSHVWLCDPMNYSSPVSSVHGIFQARILSGLPFPTPWNPPNPETEPGSHIAGRFFTIWATREAYLLVNFCNLKFFSADQCTNL